jgi:hypothetical protein
MPAPPPLDIAAVVAHCEQRVPRTLHQVRMEAGVDRHAVTPVERRAQWRLEFGPEWTSSPVTRLWWSVSRREWTLGDRVQRGVGRIGTGPRGRKVMPAVSVGTSASSLES